MKLVREHFKRNGKPKRPFDTRDDALTYARDTPTIVVSRIKVYQCRFCKKWHLATRK